METLLEIGELIARHAGGDGIHASPVERLSLVRSSTPTMPMPTLYKPTLCLVAQGRKQAVLGDRIFVYDPARYVIVSVELPVLGQVIEATPDRPYLCLALTFDPVALNELALRVPRPPDSAPQLGLSLADASPGLLEASLRLLRLLDDPTALPVLAPLAEQEILYRLLTGPHGPTSLVLRPALLSLRRARRQLGVLDREVRPAYGGASFLHYSCCVVGFEMGECVRAWRTHTLYRE